MNTTDGGRGEPADEYPIAPAMQNRIVSMMLRKDRRWETTETHRKIAIGITVRNMQSEEGRVSNGAVSNMIKMEAQNQSDDHKLIPDTHLHMHTDADSIRNRALERIRIECGEDAVAEIIAPAHANGHASGLGGDNGAGPLGNGTPPPTDQHGSNGSHHGNGSAGPDR